MLAPSRAPLSPFAALLTILVIAFAPRAAIAQTYTWTNPGIGDWFTASNWNGGIPTSSGTTLIDNGGTPTISSGSATISRLWLGGNSAGNLRLQTGGQLIVSVGATLSTFTPNTTSRIEVDGAGSQLTVFSGLPPSPSGGPGFLSIGQTGNGMVTVTNGGRVEAEITAFGLDMSPTNASGRGVVDGAGSSWISSRNFDVGVFAPGTVNITGGGLAQGGTVDIGTADTTLSFRTATGQVTVDGAGSQFISTSSLRVSAGGAAGTLTIANGGQVQSVTGIIGATTNSNGGVHLSGNGSSWTNTGDMFIGGITSAGGIGTLTVGTGAVVNNTGAIRVFDRGSIGLEGGTIQTGSLELAGGILRGTGTIAGPVTVASGGRVAPGDGQSTGRITFNNGITFTSNSTFFAVLNGTTAGTQYDQLRVTGGAIDFGGATLVSTIYPLYTPGPDDKWFIVTNDSSAPWNGSTFNGLPNGAAFTMGTTTAFIYYTGDFATGQLSGGNDVVISLVPVPEPTTALAIAASGLALGTLRRRAAHARRE